MRPSISPSLANALAQPCMYLAQPEIALHVAGLLLDATQKCVMGKQFQSESSRWCLDRIDKHAMQIFPASGLKAHCPIVTMTNEAGYRSMLLLNKYTMPFAICMQFAQGHAGVITCYLLLLP